jgi:hypothetical protein
LEDISIFSTKRTTISKQRKKKFFGTNKIMRLREFRGLAPKSFFGGLAPPNHLTMVIILSSGPCPLLPPLNNIKM